MSGKTMHYAQGAVIQLENSQNPGYIYVIKSGKINIQTGIPKKSNLSQYHPGDTYGFVSALTGNPFTSTLVATSDTEVIRLSIDSFYEYLRNNKEVFIRFLSNHSERLREYVESLSTVRIRAKRDSFEKLYYHCKTYQKLGKQDLASFALTKFIKLAESSGKNIRNLEDAKKQIQELAPDYNLPKHSQVSGKANLTLQRGEIIFLENEPDDYFYFVIQGKVKITKLIDDEEFILAILEEDEIFGEMGILNSKVRNASAIAYE
ncbi:MAG: cyclic nucleotide-binding domain-containing protein, partial [Spirochaetota bacterium]